MSPRLALPAVFLLGTLSSCAAWRDWAPVDRVGGGWLVRVTPDDFIDAIDRPVISATTAGSPIGPQETVIGVVGRDGTARAYPIETIHSRELVNDELDGEPIAVMW